LKNSWFFVKEIFSIVGALDVKKFRRKKISFSTLFELIMRINKMGITIIKKQIIVHIL